MTPSGEPFSASSEEGDGIVEAEGTANGEAEQTSLNAPKILFEDDGEQHEERHNNSQREEAPEVQPSLDNVTLVTCRNAESSVFSDKHGPKGRVLRIRDCGSSLTSEMNSASGSDIFQGSNPCNGLDIVGRKYILKMRRTIVPEHS